MTGATLIPDQDEERAMATETLRLLVQQRDTATDPHRRQFWDTLVSAIRAEYGLPEGAA